MSRMIEWIGQVPVFSSPIVEFKLAMGEYSDAQVHMMRVASRHRCYRVDNRIIRDLLRHSPEGLSKTYRFGPTRDSYVQQVTDADAAIILDLKRNPDALQFIDVTDSVAQGSAALYANTKKKSLIVADPRIHIVGTEELNSLKKLDRAFR